MHSHQSSPVSRSNGREDANLADCEATRNRTGTAAIAAASDRTDALTREDAEQQRLFGELQPLLKAKLDELAETVRVRRADGFAAAERIVRTDAGAQTMGRIRAIVDEMLDREDAHRRERRAEAASRLRLAVLTQFAIAVGAIALISLVSLVSRRRSAEAAR